MASVSRTAQFAKVFKVLKRHYKPVTPDAARPVLEHLLLACLLEDAHHEAADEAFAALVETFFDWNEIRVTTIAELAEVMPGLSDPRAAANRIKRVLQAVFEETYTFDLEERRKKNLGPTVKWLKKIDGTTNFTVAYVVQSALGGHAIPVDSGVLWALHVVDLLTDKDVKAGVVPGLDRAIAKSKGIEFGSMLHQLGADFTANRYSPALREILLEINPDCKGRLPRRRAGKKEKAEPSTEPSKEAEGDPSAAAGPKTTGEAGSQAAADRGTTGRKRASAAKEKPSSPAKQPPATSEENTASSKEKAAAANMPAQSDPKKGKSASEGLSKRKPR